jgi:phage repressor protein C with HTH and peptisase S24 domain
MSNNVNKKISHLHSEYIETGNVSKNTSSLKVQGGHVLINTKDALGRIKDELGIHTDAELAEALSVSIRRIHNWKQRNTVPTEAIVALCGSEGLDLEYILTGKKNNLVRSQQVDKKDAGAAEPQNTSTPQSRVCPPYKKFSKFDSHGNELYSFESSQLVDVLAPGTNWLVHALGVQPEDLILMKIVGDNMFPWAQDGDLVFVDTSQKSTINGGVLALRYADGTMVARRVFRNPDGTLHAKCDAECSEPELLDISNEDMYPLVVGRVIRRLVK